MSFAHILDAAGLVPVLGPFRPVDRRSLSNAYDTWTEYLCLRSAPQQLLATCVFEALAEPPEEWFDEDGEPHRDRVVDGRLFPPAFYEGAAVSGIESFICGPLIVGPDGNEAAVTLWEEGAVIDALKVLGWPIADGLVAHILKTAQSPVPPSELPKPLVSAYIETDYTVRTSDCSLLLQIGKRSEGLGALFSGVKSPTGAFITAWNPKGDAIPDAENRHRNRRLKQDLESVSTIVLAGEGTGRGRTWPAEESFFGLGLSFDHAVHLGRHYRQNAIVWAEEDCIPKLVLLR